MAELEDDVNVEVSDKKAVPPSAWKPGVVWDGPEGEITSRPSSARVPHWDDILNSWGYDPQVYEIVEPVKISTWEAQTKEGTEQLWSYKAGIRVRTSARSVPYEDLIAEIKRHRPLNPNTPDGDLTMVVCLADWQIGKADGDGLEGTVDRILKMIDGVERRIRDLRLMGRSLGTLFVVGMGDIIEGCEGNYASQQWRTQANRREQIRIARRLIRDCIARWAKHFKTVIVTAVPGNHGENRLDGKAFTDIGDNDDVALFEVVAEILAENPAAYGHVEFRIPENELSITFNLSGRVIGFTHGHVAGGGANPQAKQRKWWEDQTFGNQPMGEADILVTAHYHHFSINQYGQRCHMQCPAMDGGSEWWVNLKGAESPPGTLTFLVGADAGLSGWTDVQVI